MLKNLVLDDLETVLTIPKRNQTPKAPSGDAILVLIYPTGPLMGQRHTLGLKPLLIGREEGCDIAISDHSVSRRHASIELQSDGHFEVIDQRSTNGTLLNDQRVERARLKDGDYLHIGNCIFRFLAGGNIEAHYHEEIYRLTIVDALTETHNKRYFLEFLDREISRAVRFQRPLSLAIFDIDRFKRINDDWGHVAGDFILRELASCVRKVVRKDELFARYGGEEFALVLPECTLEQALSFAERVRNVIEEHTFEFDGEQIPVTASLGVATMTGKRTIPLLDVVKIADDSLYRAKQDGRNLVRGCIVDPGNSADMPTLGE